jgi:hypothetical protein
MTETLQLIIQIIQWVASLFGLIGGIILIIRFFKERPILKIELFSSHDINEDVDLAQSTFIARLKKGQHKIFLISFFLS